MTIANKSDAINKIFYRNLFSGLLGLATAIVFTIAVLKRLECIGPTFLMFSIFVFPLPVAIGMATGLVAPKKAILWAPLWSCILAGLVFATISGGFSSNAAGLSPWRVVGGVILAGIGGLAGELANKRNYAWQSAVLVVLACIGMMFIGRWSAAECTRVFKLNRLPRIVVALDKDYIQAPPGLDWSFRRDPKMDVYDLKTQLDGRPLLVTASMTDTKILGVEYELDGNGQNIKNSDEAKAYLMRRGFRKKLLGSLSIQNGTRPLWCASLERTRLTLSSTGDVKLETFREPRNQFPNRR